MKKFMDENFLLSNKTAERLYHEAAAQEPIFDYHCHLEPQEIAENRRFPDLASVWLGADHYKWRQMRSNGVREEYITGASDPYDKFLAWADTVPRLIGNPLYHWTHLELQRYFGIDEPLSPKSAPAIWKAAGDMLAKDPQLSVFGIFEKMNVYAVGTTDDPADSLQWHGKIEGQTKTRVLPSFRPDRVVDIEKADFAQYIAQLGAAAGTAIATLNDLLTALRGRLDFFQQHGCCIADHGLDAMPFASASTDPRLPLPSEINQARWEKEMAALFAASLAGQKPDARAVEAWKTFMLVFMGKEYARRGWVMQLHLAASRSNNTAAVARLGMNMGHDAVHDAPVAAKLSRFMDVLFARDNLPKMVLYSLNIKDLYPMATLMGCFQGEITVNQPIPGKIQLGSGWWFLDHIDGMEAQMRLLGNTGLLSRFVGMLTDSRSFLSYPRHEYFRRILCNILGVWVENGEVPDDFELLSGMVRDISFRNAERYFRMGG